MSDTEARDAAARDAIGAGRAVLGIELGSTRIKACLIGDDPGVVIAAGTHEWENAYLDGVWTYSLEEAEAGLRAAFADLVEDVRRRYGVPVTALAGLGVSAMMHGYLAFDADGDLLVPFRTWRNTTTGPAAAELSELLRTNIPLRWSIAHLHQAVLDEEPHLARLASITTLAGWVHRRLTGRDVLGVGDASGMFPIGSGTGGYDAALVARYDERAAGRVPALLSLLPEVLPAGRDAGRLTAEGAAFLDPTGGLQPGAICCPPEGDAGTGMVATNSVAPREGNVSVGTSVFAMVVLEHPLARVHEEIDLVTTPAGDPVAMVHCNNGASELAAWVGVFRRFAEASGSPLDADAAYAVLLREALVADADSGGVLAYNLLSGEPVLGLAEGRPLVVRTPGGTLSLANLMRAQVLGVFSALAIGMRVLATEDVRVERLLAHGGLFRTEGVAERILADVLDVPVVVGDVAAEGGAWGIAVLAAFAVAGGGDLPGFLRDQVFADAAFRTTSPDPSGAEAAAATLDRFGSGLAIERAAVESID